MPIETVIEENTAALVALAAAFRALTEVNGAPHVPEATKPARAPVAAPAPAPAATIPAPAAKAPAAVLAPAAAIAVSRDDCLDAVVRLSRTKSREAAVACLAEFGVAKVGELPDDKLAAVFARANALRDA